VRLTPEVRQYRHNDYFGTEVVEFEVTRPHRELTIDVRARVTTQSQAEPTGTTWAGVEEPSYRAAGAEFLVQTDDIPGHPLLTSLHSIVAEEPTPLAAVARVADLIPDRFEYRRGATYVDSPLTQLLDGEAGVCQDFSHLGLNLLRHQGIAARYVSGYLFTAGSEGGYVMEPISVNGTGARPVPGDHPVAGAVESAEVDTHAWIEALLPGDDGEPFWLSIDPTNHGFAGERHVKIGHGRHYADVPPIKGVYRGAASAELTASVTMTRLERTDPASIARS
jgi:transglutaminase-like putative cysteine protease